MSLWEEMSRRKRRVRVGLTLVTLLIFPTARPAFGAIQLARSAKVYVADFSTADNTDDDLNRFARRLFQLRLLALSGVEVASNTEIPPCAESTSQSSIPAAGINPGLQGADVSSTPVFYKIQGTLDVHSQAIGETKSNILITYELVKVSKCHSDLIYRKTRSFAFAEALQNLENAAEEMSAQLSDDLSAKATVRVETIEARGDTGAKYRSSELLTQFLRDKVANADALRLWDDNSQMKPDYTLQGQIQFTDNANSAVKVSVHFTVNGKTLPVSLPDETEKASVEELVPFYLAASRAAVKGVSDVLYEERAGLSTINAAGTDVIQQARQLLCDGPGGAIAGCTADPQAVLLLLNETSANADSARHAEIAALAGEAHYLSKEYLAAGESFDSAVGATTVRDAKSLSLLLRAGDAWYESKQYSKASERYRECLAIASTQGVSAEDRLQPAVRLKLLHSLRLADQPEAAFETLVDGLKAAHDWPRPDDSSKTLFSNFKGEMDAVLESLPSKALDSAAAKLDSELSFDPELYSSAEMKISRIYAGNGMYDQAIRGYRKVLEIVPNYPNAHFYLGYALDQKHQVAEAIDEYRKAIVANAKDADAHNNLGAALSETRQYDLAIAEYRQAVKFRPNYTLALNNLAGLLYFRGKYEEAITTYREAIRSRPDDTQAYFNLWWVYQDQAKNDDAREVFKSLQAVAPNDRYTQLIAARMQENAQDFAAAARIYSKLVESYPGEPTYVNDLASAEIRGGMNLHDRQLIQSGVKRLENTLSTAPSFDAYFDLGWAYHIIPEIRDLDKAEALYRKALAYQSDNSTLLGNLAALAMEKGDTKTVIQMEEDRLKINPKDADALDTLGYARFLSGDLSAAKENYKKSTTYAPEDPLHHAAYGEALLWLGESSAAHEELSQARKLMSKPEISPTTWTWLIQPVYDPSEKMRLVYYSTILQRQAAVELLDAVAYLRENRVASALQALDSASGKLKPDQSDDREVMLKAMNDLHRLEKEARPDAAANLGLGYLYDWLGAMEPAKHHWELYLRSGTDPEGREKAQRRLAQTRN